MPEAVTPQGEVYCTLTVPAVEPVIAPELALISAVPVPPAVIAHVPPPGVAPIVLFVTPAHP